MFTEKVTDTSPTFFSFWRPAIGWLSMLGLGYQFLFVPVVGAITTFQGKPIILPNLDTEPLVTLIIGVLGLGGLRTWEKLKQVQDKH